MALHVPQAPGFASMLKEGSRYLKGLEEAVLQNIEACGELAKTTRTSYGPTGLNKMVINHLEKLFVTNDAATILNELEVQHPAAKLLVMASKQQEEECGDGTNFVLMFSAALLRQAEELLRMGLSVAEVTTGYEVACKKALEILETLVVSEIKDFENKDEVLPPIRSAVMSKQYGNEDFLADIIADACISVKTKVGFNVDNIRVVKMIGSGITSSKMMSGMVVNRNVEGDIKTACEAKIVCYSCPLDIMQTETKGTVLLKTAQELMDYSKGEENIIEDQFKAIHDAGVKVIVTGGKVGELALHFANKYELLVVRLNSKFELRRLCRTVNATALPKVVAPTPEEMGFCDSVTVEEIGDAPVVVFRQNKEGQSRISTIIVRGSTVNTMDDIERAINDGVNTYKALTKDPRLLPGAAAVEMELNTQLISWAKSHSGLEQYAITKFAEALEEFPRALAENSGVPSNELISHFRAAHAEDKKNWGFDLVSGEAKVCNSIEQSKVFDLFITKFWALKFATNVTNTILQIDHIIWAKEAGGPKAKENKKWDED